MGDSISWLLTVVETEQHTARQIAVLIDLDAIEDDGWVEFPMEYREQIQNILSDSLMYDDIIVDIQGISDVAVIKKPRVVADKS